MKQEDKFPAPIRIGIYGRSKAGKTRFLFQLLNQWEKSGVILSQSKNCQVFISTMEKEIAKRRGTLVTNAAIEDINVIVSLKDPRGDHVLVFRDMRGELLEDELIAIEEMDQSGVRPPKPPILISSQLKDCDAFLFFFDPTSSEKPGEIDGHHERELGRAESFIKHVLKERQNRLMPIVFVQTRLDVLMNCPEIQEKADTWAMKVHEKLKARYKSVLGNLIPPSMKEKDKVIFQVSSTGMTKDDNEKIKRVVGSLIVLTKEAEAYTRGRRIKARWLFGGGIAVIVAFIALILIIQWKGYAPSQPRGPTTNTEIVAKLDSLDDLLKALPQEGSLPDERVSIQINNNLKWLGIRLGVGVNGSDDLAEKTKKRMQSGLDSIKEYISKKTKEKGLGATRLAVFLESSLKECPDFDSVSPEFSQIQQDFWKLKRDSVVDELGDLIKIGGGLESKPLDTLEKLLIKARELETQVGQCKVRENFGDKALKKQINDEIKKAVAFFEDRIKNGYEASIEVINPSFGDGEKGDISLRNLNIASPGRDKVFGAGIGLYPNNNGTLLEVNARIEWGKGCWDGYDNEVRLTFGKMDQNSNDNWVWNIKSKAGTFSNLESRRISGYNLNDQIKFDADIKVKDGVFPISSRRAQGSFENAGFLLSDILTEPKIFPLDKFDNKVHISASVSTDQKNASFYTKEKKYPCQLSLGAPVSCILSVYNPSNRDWTQKHKVDLTVQKGPLNAIGLPLIEEEGKAKTIKIEGSGIELQMVFSGFPPVPQLIWDAANKVNKME